MQRHSQLRRNAFSHQLRFEALEDRRLLALVAEMVADLVPGNAEGGAPLSSSPRLLTRADDDLFFAAWSEEGREKVWQLNDASQATRVVYDPGENPYVPDWRLFAYEMQAVNGALFFTTRNTSPFERDSEGLKYVGPESQTAAHLWSPSCSIWDGCERRAENLAGVDGRLFFSGGNGEPWMSDGTMAGTRSISDVYPGYYVDPWDMNNITHYNSLPDGFTAVNGTVVFRAFTEHGRTLWRTDGTNSGTQPLQDECGVANSPDCGKFSSSGPMTIVSTGDRAYFVAAKGNSGEELWTTDGTSSGTYRVKDIHPTGSASPRHLSTIGTRVAFSATDGTHGQELWISDGTAEGTHLVKDIRPSGSSAPQHLTTFGTQVAFIADDGARGRELWITDGSPAGTVRLKDIQAGWPSSNPKNLVAVNGLLFFVADDGIHGEELWVTDGTGGGTQIVEDFLPGAAGSMPTELTAFDGALYFTADDGVHGRELWKVSIVNEIVPGDTDADGDVDLEDLNNVRDHFGETGEGVLGDTSPFDGVVNLDDLNAVRNHFGGAGNAIRTASSVTRFAPRAIAPASAPRERAREDAEEMTLERIGRRFDTRAADLLFTVRAKLLDALNDDGFLPGRHRKR